MLPELDACWTRIGVEGDGSCPQLASVVHCRNCPVYARAGRQLLEQAPPAGYVEQWAEQVAGGPQREDADTLSIVVFRIGDEHLAIPTADFVEVVEPRPVHRIPHRSGAVLLGVANLRGELQLCVSLAALLSLAPPADGGREARGRPRLAVIERDGDRWVFPVDEILGVQRIARRLLAAPPTTVGRDTHALTSALFALGDARVALLDAAPLFARLRAEVA